MTVKLEIMDYRNQRYDTGVEIDLDKLKFMLVEVVSGDEILMPYFGQGKPERLDAMDFADDTRVLSYEDGSYIVDKSNFEAWSKREDTYEFLFAWGNE